MEPYVWKRRADGVLDIVTKRETVVSHVFSISQAFTFLTLARLGRNLSSLLVSSLLSKILMISVSFRLVLTVTVPSWNSPLTPVLKQSLVVSPPVLSLTTSLVRLRSLVLSLLPTPVWITRPSVRRPMSTYPSLLSVTQMLPSNSLMLPSLQITRPSTRLVSFGGCSPVRFWGFVAQYPDQVMAGMSWSICSFTEILKRSRSSNKRRLQLKQLLLPVKRPLLSLPSGRLLVDIKLVLSTRLRQASVFDDHQLYDC